MDESRPAKKKRLPRLRFGRKARAANRPPRKPTGTLIVALLWLVFMLVVWFQAPGVTLPVFFQRMVGIVAALLTMLVVMFAIREHAKRFNRVPVPWIGRVSTSRVAGAIVFVAVLAWWISPWTPIPAGEPQADLWGLLEAGLNRPLLLVVDTDLAVFALPAPSAEARQAANRFAPGNDLLRRAWVAIATGKFDEAQKFLDRAGGDGADRVQESRAELELYRGQYAAASARYREMLRIEPRREDFLTHGALAATLAGDYPTATAWAEQLLDQARARGRNSPRAVEAADLLASVQLVAGSLSDAAATVQAITNVGAIGSLAEAGDFVQFDDATAANNLAVIRLMASGESADTSAASDFARARELWKGERTSHGAPRDVASQQVAVAEYNLGAAALYQSRYGQAAALLIRSLADWRSLYSANVDSAARIGLATNLNALARLDLLSGRYESAESRIREANDWLKAAGNGDAAKLALLSTKAEIDAGLAKYDPSASALETAIHEAEQSLRGLTPNHPYLAVLKLRLAETQLAAGKDTAAEMSATEAQRILEHAGLTTSRAFGDALRIAGEAAIDQRKYDDAATLLDRATKLYESLPTDTNEPPDETRRASASLEQARLLAAEGKLADRLQNYTAAADNYHEALSRLDTLFEQDSASNPLRAIYLDALAMVLVHDEKFAEAKPLLEQALAIDRRALPPAHPATIAVMKDLAGVFEKTGQKSQAEQLSNEADKLLRAGPSDRPGRRAK